MILEFLIFIATVLLLHYVYLLWNKDYWEKRGVFCPKSDLLLGNLPGQITGKRNMFYELDDLYQKYKKDHSLIGLYNFRSPRLLIFDPELLRDLLVKYFKYFQANEFTNRIDIKSDPLFGNHSFFLIGDAWKNKRSEVSPAFSNTRVRNLIKLNFRIFLKQKCFQIRALFPVMFDSCNKMSKYIKEQEKTEEFEGFDAKDVRSNS